MKDFIVGFFVAALADWTVIGCIALYFVLKDRNQSRSR